MKKYWAAHPRPKATAADIAGIETGISSTLPVPYVEFITQFGFVTFGDDYEELDCFDYILTFPDRQEIRQGDIAALREPDRLLKAYRILTNPEIEDDDLFPKFPKKYLPIANTAGQNEVLLELGENAGRVWYWVESEWAWGLEGNTRLGFVAENFHEFISKLRPFQD